MTDQEYLAELDRRRAAMAGNSMPAAPVMQPAATMPPPPPGFTSWMAPAPMQPTLAAGVRPVGLLVSITVPTPHGEVPCYLQLGSEAAANPQMAIQQLMQAGWPVKTWQPRQQGWPNGGGGGFGGGRGWGRRY